MQLGFDGLVHVAGQIQGQLFLFLLGHGDPVDKLAAPVPRRATPGAGITFSASGATLKEPSCQRSTGLRARPAIAAPFAPGHLWGLLALLVSGFKGVRNPQQGFPLR